MTVIGIEGGVSRDHLVNVDNGAEFNVPGGPGVYASLASLLAVRWLEASAHPSALPSAEVRVFGEGADTAIDEMLSNAGTNTSWLPICVSTPTLWILTSATGRRIIRADIVSGHELGPDSDEYTPTLPTPSSFYTGLDALLLCSPRDSSADIEQDTLVAVDPDQREIARRGWGYFEELAETATLFLPSRVQLTQLGSDHWKVAQELRRRTGRSVVARADAEGCLVLPFAGGAWHVPAPLTRVVDTTGAGDSHAAALVSALSSPLGRDDLVRSAAIASLVGALTVSDWGPRALLRTSPEGLGGIDSALAHLTITERNTGATS
ncbi:MAG: PfkB family carbohydrate kinase [Terrimesophilobacter sp.]